MNGKWESLDKRFRQKRRILRYKEWKILEKKKEHDKEKPKQEQNLSERKLEINEKEEWHTHKMK